MTRYVVTPDVVLRLAREGRVVAAEHQLVAPALIRSQLNAALYDEASRGETTKRDAKRVMDAFRAMKVRLLGDRVLQQVAWEVAEELGWADTYRAEYVALTKLQADALVTLDDALAEAAGRLVGVATYDDLL